jgi:hypothetical protein
MTRPWHCCPEFPVEPWRASLAHIFRFGAPC